MTRVRVALAAVIAAALMPAAGELVQVTMNLEILRPRDDEMSMFERSFAPMRAALRGEKVVGYLEPPGLTDRDARLYSIRYALAPVQVVGDIDQPLVVADGVADPQRLPPQLRVRRDFGGGLLLLERAR